MRDYSRIDKYLNELVSDVYSQPPDEGHLAMIQDVFDKWIYGMDCKSVLDIGCGSEAIAEPLFRTAGMWYTGISIGEDAVLAQSVGKNVLDMDMSFLEFDDESFDLVWCRHTLEHSPMPLLTLMEFHRVSKEWLCVIMPNPQYYTYSGRNHYYVAEAHQVAWLLRRAGWQPVKVELNQTEFRFLCVKQPRIGYEGYVEAPLPNTVYEFERDGLDVTGVVVDVQEFMTALETSREER